MKTFAVLFLVALTAGCVAVPVGYPTTKWVVYATDGGGLVTEPPWATAQKCTVFNGRRFCEDESAQAPLPPVTVVVPAPVIFFPPPPVFYSPYWYGPPAGGFYFYYHRGRRR